MMMENPKKKQRNAPSSPFEHWTDDIDPALQAWELNRNTWASLVERAACCLGNGHLLRLLHGTYIHVEVAQVLTPAMESRALQARETLPPELQCLPQYWLAKAYLDDYSGYRDDYDPHLIPTAFELSDGEPNRVVFNWLLHPHNLQMPPCIVKGFRWLEWKSYSDAKQGIRAASRWVYLSPMSNNILIHGVLTLWHGYDTVLITFCLRRGPSQPWNEKGCFRYTNDHEEEGHCCFEVVGPCDQEASVWPFSFPLPHAPDHRQNKYKIDGCLLDNDAPPSEIIWYQAEVGSKYATGGRKLLTQDQASDHGREAMLWLRWILGLDPTTTILRRNASKMCYPWACNVLLPTFQKTKDKAADTEARLALKARWTHAATMLSRRKITPKLPPFRAEL